MNFPIQTHSTDWLIKHIREADKFHVLEELQTELQSRRDYNPNAIRIPYSQAQWCAFVDSSLYGFSYGTETGEDEYIEAEMAKLGHKKGKYRYVRMDDHNCEHVCEVSE